MVIFLLEDMNMKSGVKTSEMWLTTGVALVSSVVAIVVALGVLTPEEGEAVSSATIEVVKAIVIAVGVIGSVVSVGIYANGRAKVKAAVNGIKE